MSRNLSNLNDFINNLHKLGYSIVDYNDIKIPILYVEDQLFDKFVNNSYNKKISIDTTLNIYDDGSHIFVDINLHFFDMGLEENFLLYANETLDFFYNLSTAGMLGLAPASKSQANVFFIQLPKKERAEKAFEMIHKKLKKNKSNIDD
ncbi:MAG TPA: hypothetical protein VER14_00245 [Phototrophicaceae bacterium]|nr:hypothetical protein [Phototrophicaceae bacterium]